MCDFDNIRMLLDELLGNPKRDGSSNGWYEYDCPQCADEAGHPDGKHNLAVQLDEEGLWFHCWKCGYNGKLARLFKQYGTIQQYEQFKDQVNLLKEKHFYEIKSGKMEIIGGFEEYERLTLPDGFMPLKREVYGSSKALAYAYNRGLTDEIIERFNIGFIGGDYTNYGLKERIIIPSYNSYNELNYWVARDYTGNNRYKIMNANVDKTKIVFNEAKINWYEPITLVEGPFDHIVVPNSIPLLGKTLKEDSEIFKCLYEKCESNINIMLDDDAIDNAYKIYKTLFSTFRNRVRLIESPQDLDASDVFRTYGKRGILKLLRNAHKVSEFKLNTII